MDPDPGGPKKHADPADPDPQHWFYFNNYVQLPFNKESGGEREHLVFLCVSET